jgi:hypothetical protein
MGPSITVTLDRYGHLLNSWNASACARGMENSSSQVE